MFLWFDILYLTRGGQGKSPCTFKLNIFLARQGEREAFMYNTKDFFKDFRFWYESAKESKKWSSFQYRNGRLRGMIEIANQAKIISINTWTLLETLLEKLEDAAIEKGLN